MKAIAVIPGTTTVRLVDRPEPTITTPHDVKLRTVRVGICGTDREEARGGRSRAPAGQQDLVIGHEMMGQVVEVGSAVTRVAPGDFAAFTVRRGCGHCLSCGVNRSDMCQTGEYSERGIWGRDGYQAEFVVDAEDYIVRIPPELADVGVLAEPLSVVEKAIDEALHAAARRPDAAVTPEWLSGRRCLVAGLGPIGLLGAMALRLRGAEVYGLDVVDAASARPHWLEAIGGHYLDGRQVAADRIDDSVGGMDLILEATGIASLEFNLLDALALNGVYVLTGIACGDRPIEVHGASLMRQLVLRNLAMVGSVNAARGHFQMGVNDLTSATQRWGSQVAALITQHYPVSRFLEPLTEHHPDAIKEVIDWS
ncbi:MAG TPA: glucose 1-dehydrogenase [Gemmatimonadaceae bacterium]|nr:glucose 1-dehydrogenase [Gemmatimonadaceae bacterium]